MARTKKSVRQLNVDFNRTVRGAKWQKDLPIENEIYST